MKNKSEETVLQLLMQGLVGKQILKVNAGGSTGSIFCLEIGETLKVKLINGREVTEGDFSIMIYSSWRLDNFEMLQPITSWQEDSGLEGKMTSSLKDLLNDVIEKVSLTSFYDLDIQFRSGKRLAVFSDLTSNQEMDTNWFFRDREKYYSVNKFFELVVE